MTFEEKLDRLDGIFAMDNGAASSGIRDDKFKEEMKTDSDLEKLLLHLTRRYMNCLLYTSPSPRDKRQSRMPSSA